MKIKYKLTAIGVAMALIVAVSVTVVLVNRASQISRELSSQSLEHLSESIAEYWDGRLNSHIRVLRTLANVMAGYESLELNSRAILSTSSSSTATRSVVEGRMDKYAPAVGKMAS